MIQFYFKFNEVQRCIFTLKSIDVDLKVFEKANSLKYNPLRPGHSFKRILQQEEQSQKKGGHSVPTATSVESVAPLNPLLHISL